jgi:hypothetical protein
LSSGAVDRRTAKRGSGWRPVAFQAPRWRGAARGKRSQPLVARSCGRGRRRWDPGHGGRQHGAASDGPRLSGTGGGAVAQPRRAIGCGRRGAGGTDRWGRDESRAWCQRWGTGGRGVSEAAQWRGADRRARLAQCRAARFKMDSTIFIDSNGFKNLQTLTDLRNTFPYSKNVK